MLQKYTQDLSRSIIIRKRDKHLPCCSLLKREAVIVLILLGLSATGTIGALAIGILLTLWSFLGSKQAIQAMTLSVLFTFVNPCFFTPITSSFKFIILFSSCASAVFHYCKNMPRRSIKIPGWLLSLLAFITTAIILAVLSSKSCEISIFKIALFAVGFVAATCAFSTSEIKPIYFLNWFYTIHLVVLSSCLVMLPTPGGYLRGTRFFMGSFCHSQSLGTFLAPMTALLVCGWISHFRLPIQAKLATLASLYILFLSNSRTAMSSVLLASIISLLIGLISGRTNRKYAIRGMAYGSAILALLIGINMSTSGSLGNLSRSFYEKGGDTSSILTSRAEKASDGIQAFINHPAFGVGFGMHVSDILEPSVTRDPIFGFPISAPVEASVMYTALPGQIGIIGMIPFLILMVVYFRPVFKNSLPLLLAACVAEFAINAGEYIFFSTGGLGLYGWLIFSFIRRASIVHYQQPSLFADPTLRTNDAIRVSPI